MVDAVNILWSIYSKFIDLIFNKFAVSDGVTLGYIVLVCGVLALLIRNIIFLPRRGGAIHIGRKGGDDDE